MARVAPSERFRAQLNVAVAGVGQAQDPVGTIGRAGRQLVMQQALQGEVSEFLGRARYERADETGSHRNGYEPRKVRTTAGTVELRSRRSQTEPACADRRRRRARPMERDARAVADRGRAALHGASRNVTAKLSEQPPPGAQGALVEGLRRGSLAARGAPRAERDRGRQPDAYPSAMAGPRARRGRARRPPALALRAPQADQNDEPARAHLRRGGPPPHPGDRPLPR
jgi:Transposase, Mutator family